MFFGTLTRRAGGYSSNDGKFYSYAYFRQKFQIEIAEDCRERCVYCDTHENAFGGRECMEIDHFRPYTVVGFEHLEDDPTNFHHACPRCNRLKSDWWPSTAATASHDGDFGFIDPFQEDRADYFEVNPNGELLAKKGPAEYLIELLALNRPFLRRLREYRMFIEAVDSWLPILVECEKGNGPLSAQEALRAANLILRVQRHFAIA
jgi:hypothetical protein